jgi:predicted transcriptional regulator
MLARKTDDGKLRPIGEDQRFAEAARVLGDLNSEIAALRRSVQKLQGASWLHSQAEEGLSGPQALEQAQRLLAGEAVDDFSDLPSKIRKAQHKLAILEPAAREQAQRLEVIRGEASATAGEHVKARHRKALLELLRAARLLAIASNAERAIRNELLENGYQMLDGLTPAPS